MTSALWSMPKSQVSNTASSRADWGQLMCIFHDCITAEFLLHRLGNTANTLSSLLWSIINMKYGGGDQEITLPASEYQHEDLADWIWWYHTRVIGLLWYKKYFTLSLKNAELEFQPFTSTWKSYKYDAQFLLKCIKGNKKILRYIVSLIWTHLVSQIRSLTC